MSGRSVCFLSDSPTILWLGTAQGEAIDLKQSKGGGADSSWFGTRLDLWSGSCVQLVSDLYQYGFDLWVGSCVQHVSDLYQYGLLYHYLSPPLLTNS